MNLLILIGDTLKWKSSIVESLWKRIYYSIKYCRIQEYFSIVDPNGILQNDVFDGICLNKSIIISDVY